VTLLIDLILASTSIQEIKSNDIALEIMSQLKACQPQVATSIEENMEHAETVEQLFTWNDKCQTVLMVFVDMTEKRCLGLLEGQRVLRSANANGNAVESSVEAHKSPRQPATPAAVTNDLVDFDTMIMMNNEAANEVRSRQNSRVKSPVSPQQPVAATATRHSPNTTFTNQQPPVATATTEFADFANFAAFASPAQQQQAAMASAAANSQKSHHSNGGGGHSNHGHGHSPKEKEEQNHNNSSKQKGSNLIVMEDPFSDEALDVLLSTPADSHKSQHHHHHAQQPPPPHYLQQQQQQQQQYPPQQAHTMPLPTGYAPGAPYGGYPVQYPGYPAYPTGQQPLPQQQQQQPPQYMGYPAGYPGYAVPNPNANPAYPGYGAYPYPPPQQQQPQYAAYPPPTNANNAPTNNNNNNNAQHNPFDIFE